MNAIGVCHLSSIARGVYSSRLAIKKAYKRWKMLFGKRSVHLKLVGESASVSDYTATDPRLQTAITKFEPKPRIEFSSIVRATTRLR